MGRSPALSSAVGLAVALLALGVLAVDPTLAGASGSAPVGRTAAEAPTPQEQAAIIGLAAIAGAGVEVRHTMQAAGPDPSVTLAPSPSSAPSPSTSNKPARSSGIPAAWHSGASGDAAINGTFGAWRGEGLQIVGTWSDTSADAQTSMGSVDDYAWWDGDLDIAVGGLVKGETFERAAAGAYVDRWTTAIRNLRAKRAGKPGVTYVRFLHEMNGNWFDWSVTPGNVGDFKKTWRLYHNLLEREYPQAKLVFSPNDGNCSGVPMEVMWPGDDVVDVISPDTYDSDPVHNTAAIWDEWFMSEQNGPMGIGAWRSFARRHGKPMGLGEWGLRNTDNPLWISKMHAFLASCAAEPGDRNLAGKCIYDVYFNIKHNGNASYLIYGGPNERSAQTYKALSWGSR